MPLMLLFMLLLLLLLLLLSVIIDSNGCSVGKVREQALYVAHSLHVF